MEDEARRLSDGAFGDVTGRKLHAYCRLNHIIGRKPGKGE